MHTPVLLQKTIDFLEVKKEGLYIDATFGEGGHGIEIIKKGGKLLGIEWDEIQYKRSKIKFKNLLEEKRLILVNDNFKKIDKIAQKNNFFPIDGVIFDLGLSATQIFEGNRGFSYNKLNEDLDLRINSSLKLTGADLINSLDQQQLYEIFAKYSEEVNSLRLSQAIISARKVKRISKVRDLIEIINRNVESNEKIYARIFQALRIVVNNELENLKEGLMGAFKILKPTGRVLVISFHSVEDRLVKNFVIKNKLKFLTKKPIRAKNNLSFERSAILRVITF